MTNLVDAMPPVGLQIRSDFCRLIVNYGNANGAYSPSKVTRRGSIYAVNESGTNFGPSGVAGSLPSIGEIPGEALAYTQATPFRTGTSASNREEGICVVCLEAGKINYSEVLFQVNGYCKARVLFPVYPVPALGYEVDHAYQYGPGSVSNRLYAVNGQECFGISQVSASSTGGYKMFAKLIDVLNSYTTAGHVGQTKLEDGTDLLTGTGGVVLANVLLLGVAGFSSQANL